jgi:hypothetical protein
MSKFFNETQKANQWAQQKLANQDVDVKEMLESLKQGPASGTPSTDTRLSQCRQVQVGDGHDARLVLNQGEASRAALEAYRGLRTRLIARRRQDSHNHESGLVLRAASAATCAGY